MPQTNPQDPTDLPLPDADTMEATGLAGEEVRRLCLLMSRILDGAGRMEIRIAEKAAEIGRALADQDANNPLLPTFHKTMRQHNADALALHMASAAAVTTPIPEEITKLRETLRETLFTPQEDVPYAPLVVVQSMLLLPMALDTIAAILRRAMQQPATELALAHLKTDDADAATIATVEAALAGLIADDARADQHNARMVDSLRLSELLASLGGRVADPPADA